MHQSEAALAEIERIRQLESSHPALMALTLRAQAAPES
jgi:hypothetical protein